MRYPSFFHSPHQSSEKLKKTGSPFAICTEGAVQRAHTGVGEQMKSSSEAKK